MIDSTILPRSPWIDSPGHSCGCGVGEIRIRRLEARFLLIDSSIRIGWTLWMIDA